MTWLGSLWRKHVAKHAPSPAVPSPSQGEGGPTGQGEGKSKRRGMIRLVLVTSGVLAGAAILSVLLHPAPSFESVRAATRSSEAVLLDRHGVEIERLRLDRSRRMLDWIPLDATSPTLQKAVIAAEDQHFYWHPGVDPAGMASAFIDNLRRSRPRGASTITMQLASILNESEQTKEVKSEIKSGRGWWAKLIQMRDALALELRWNKREILEAYLNRVSFRGELVGVDAASRGLLAKGPGGLDTVDAAILAALVRAPGASRIVVAKRACGVLQAMQESGLCERAAFLASGLPRKAYTMPGKDEAPHLARRLLKNPGERMQVTLDANLQRFARETLRTRLAELSDRNVEDGAVVVLDNQTGDVLAYVGSSGDLSGAPEVDGVAAMRQPGSTLKPFLYAAAMDQGWLNASSVLDDSPLALTTPSGLYIPQDYDKTFRGAVSVRAALGSSLNVPAVRTLTLVGVERFLKTLRDLGLDSLTREANHYGFGLALGGAETSLLQLTNAYRTLANHGEWSPTRFMSETKSNTLRRIFSPQASFVISDILADPAARALTFGLSSPLSTRTWSAVKTGTSKAMRDNWAIGFTDRYTVGVWVGNFSGAPMWDVSGVTGAAPVWRDVVEYLHEGQASRAPLPPSGVMRQKVAYQPPIEAPREDWMIGNGKAGDDLGHPVVLKVASAKPLIVAPPDSAIIAPDPDIPQSRQAMLLQANGVGEGCLMLDGKVVGQCKNNKVMMPIPLPGSHLVELVDKKGKVMDAHRFEVRGLNLGRRRQ